MPRRLASITRRQTSTVASSPRSLAASSTSQAVSTGDLSDWASPAAERMLIESMVNFLRSTQYRCSARRDQRLGAKAGLRRSGIPARTVKFENALRRLDVETIEIALQRGQLACRDAVILCAEEKQRHGGLPGKLQRFGQDQQHLPVPVDHGALDHVDRKRGQQRQSNRDLFEFMRHRVAGYRRLVQVAQPVLG